MSAYLAPEPLLQNPKWVKDETKDGMSVPMYAYAASNPIHFTDPDGLQTCPPMSPCAGCTLTSVAGTDCWVCPVGKGAPRGGVPLCVNRCGAVKTAICIPDCIHELGGDPAIRVRRFSSALQSA